MLPKLHVVSLLSALTSAKIWYAGVNESGGEFGVYSANAINGTGLPGRYGIDYQFIDQSTVDIFVSQGVNLFRVAFLLERICPTQYGLGRKFNETYYNYFEMAVNYITDVKGKSDLSSINRSLTASSRCLCYSRPSQLHEVQ